MLYYAKYTQHQSGPPRSPPCLSSLTEVTHLPESKAPRPSNALTETLIPPPTGQRVDPPPMALEALPCGHTRRDDVSGRRITLC